MTLSHVALNDPHVDAHNAERDAINELLTTAITAGILDARLASYILTSKIGQASGVAQLDSTSKVPVGQIPDLSASYATVTALNTAIANFSATFTPPGLLVLGQDDPIPPYTAANSLIIRTVS